MGGIGSSHQQNFIKETVHDNCVVIFSTTTCPYCRIAKDVFRQMQVPTKVIELNQRSDGSDVMRSLRTVTGMSTVPQVFVNGTCIGGGTETTQLYSSGRLLQLVEQCSTKQSFPTAQSDP
jgi:glutaredoxin 3